MPIEVELKARVPESPAIPDGATGPVPATYQDTYFDTPGRDLERSGQELRVRVITTDSDRRVVLTHKGDRLDAASQPEHEATVADAAEVASVLRGLSYVPVISFEKSCANYRLDHRDHEILLTVVRILELDHNETFVEIETIVDDPAEVADATATIRSVLTDQMGYSLDSVTDEMYVDAVRQHRQLMA